MKVILSRKGFDSAAGGCPSPIIDGRPISMPIPAFRTPTPTTYGDLNGPYGALVEDLTKGQLTAQNWCHLDPDITVGVLARHPDWRGAFGQTDIAQAHLARQQIGPGDLFLFWGLFRPVECRGGRWKFIGRSEHRIWGWLQVGEIIDLGEDGSHAACRYPWLADHPHVRSGWSPPNVIYVASESLRLGDRPASLPGHGVMSRGHTLSVPGGNVSIWAVPSWLHPLEGGSGMTYHPPPRWIDGGLVQTASRGQEFVANIGENGAAIDWLAHIIADGAA